MDPAQAFDVLEQLTPQIPTTLPNHRLIRQALDTLREALADSSEPEPVDNGRAPTRQPAPQI